MVDRLLNTVFGAVNQVLHACEYAQKVAPVLKTGILPAKKENLTARMVADRRKQLGA